jgi:hypothetical protein
MFLSSISLLKQGLLVCFCGIKSNIFFLLHHILIYFFSFIVGFVVLFDTSVLQIIKFFINVINLIRKYAIGAAPSKKKSLAKAADKKEAVYIQNPLDSMIKDSPKQPKRRPKMSSGLHLFSKSLPIPSPTSGQLSIATPKPSVHPVLKCGNTRPFPSLTTLLEPKLIEEMSAKMPKL